MSNNTEINFQNERIVNRTETKGLNLSEIKGKNAIGPDETGTKDVFISWLESNENVKYFEYTDFKNLKSIGKGSYGSVFRANWKNSDQVFALKSFNNDETTLYQIINELKLHLNINHENILRFCGYTKIETDIVYQMSKYVLVLEYADSGTLNTYLKKHIDELKWNDKLNLALQLANAVSHLHDNNVLHRDLHANNILIHKKNIKLADFGLSKKIAQQSSNTSRILGVVPYTDPKSFMNENYKLNKKSDVYSVGVLLWQISSGYEPFKDKGFDYDLRLVISINNGLREKSVDGTPKEYTKLYSECWNYEPDERPDMHQVVTVLRELNSNKPNVIYNFNKKKKNYLLKNNNGFNNFNDYNISLVSINTSLNIDENESFIIEYENNLTSTVVDKLINCIIKKHDLGSTFNQIQQFIIQRILKAPENFVVWLSKNQNKIQYVWFLGLFYYYNIDTPDTEESSSKAFKLFSQASDKNFPLAQVYLGKCFYDGYETEQNKYKAFIEYEKSAKNGSVLGQFYLGYCYEFGIGTKKNERKSVYWYKKADDNGNTTARLYLAYCYRFGKGVEKDEIQAFKYYKTLAKKNKIADAQQQLGKCYYYGIGIDIDKEKACYWYKKAISNGNIIAKEIINKYYKDNNIKTKKNINTNRINLYVILFFKNLRQLGLYYVGGILLIMNFKKAFYYFQKAAGKGNKHAQYMLGNFYKNGEYVKKNVRKAFELCQKSAKQGYKPAQFQLGYYYDNGIGVDINKVNAFELYNLAAEKGHNIAQNKLGILYLKGEGIGKNLELAFYWFQEAANNGENSAQYNLGLCYELGLGIGKNERKAFGLYKKSAANGNINAKFQLGYCYVNGIGTEIDREKGFELYNKAAGKKNNYTHEKVNDLDKVCDLYYKENDAKALYNLGLCYEFGQGVYQNEIMAFEFYKKSAHQSFIDAQYKLGYCYYHGIGVDIDKETAFKLYKLAAENGNCDAKESLAFLQDNEINNLISEKKS